MAEAIHTGRLHSVQGSARFCRIEFTPDRGQDEDRPHHLIGQAMSIALTQEQIPSSKEATCDHMHGSQWEFQNSQHDLAGRELCALSPSIKPCRLLYRRDPSRERPSRPCPWNIMWCK